MKLHVLLSTLPAISSKVYSISWSSEWEQRFVNLSWFGIILSTNSRAGWTECEKRKIRMCLGMSFSFYLILPAASSLASPLCCFLFPAYGAQFGAHCCFCKHCRSDLEPVWSANLPPPKRQALRNWGDRGHLPSSNGKEWFILTIYMKWTWGTGDLIYASLSLCLVPITWTYFYFLVYFLLLHFHSYHFIHCISKSRHCATYLTCTIHLIGRTSWWDQTSGHFMN